MNEDAQDSSRPGCSLCCAEPVVHQIGLLRFCENCQTHLQITDHRLTDAAVLNRFRGYVQVAMLQVEEQDVYAMATHEILERKKLREDLGRCKQLLDALVKAVW